MYESPASFGSLSRYHAGFCRKLRSLCPASFNALFEFLSFGQSFSICSLKHSVQGDELLLMVFHLLLPESGYSVAKPEEVYMLDVYTALAICYFSNDASIC